MKVLFLGDLVGRDARDAVAEQVPILRKTYNLDAVIVNAENAAHGFGLTPQICDELFAVGVDCITTGNHIWDKREIIPYLEKEPRVLRPANFPPTAPGRGFVVFETARGEKVMVANLMARLFMDALDDPFAAADHLCKSHTLGRDVAAIFIDFHGEASSEKMAMGHFLDGRASFVVGTHTHVPTADVQILPGGTGYQTDAGMCGSYDSVIGMDKNISVTRFVRKVPGERMFPAEGPVTLCGVMFETDPKTGLCRGVEAVRIGGRLSQALPKTA